MKALAWILIAIGLMMAMPVMMGFMALAASAVPVLGMALFVWLALTVSRGPRYRRPPLERRWNANLDRPGRPAASRHALGHPAPARPAWQSDLPGDVELRVGRIRRKAAALQERAAGLPGYSKDVYLVREIAADYLPRTLEAYRSLPRERRDRAVGLNGKSATGELREQLDLLESKLDEIALALRGHELDRLLANRRFLEERCAPATPELADR